MKYIGSKIREMRVDRRRSRPNKTSVIIQEMVTRELFTHNLFHGRSDNLIARMDGRPLKIYLLKDPKWSRISGLLIYRPKVNHGSRKRLGPPGSRALLIHLWKAAVFDQDNAS